MTLDLAELPWLPRPPTDFRARLRAIEAEASPRGEAVRSLVGYALDGLKLDQVARVIARLGQQRLAPLSPLRLSVLGNGSVEFLLPALVASAARHGVALEVHAPPFGTLAQELLDPNSETRRFAPEVVLFALDHRWLETAARFELDPSGEPPGIEELRHLCSTVRELGAIPMVQTLACPPDAIFGSFDARAGGTLRNTVLRLNQRLVELASSEGLVLADIARVAETVGVAPWFDPTHWNIAKLPFAPRFIPLYADHVGRLLGAIRGKARKCLVLDLDNTLWGGVIGDDGLGGIRIGQGDPTGEAHLQLQRWALDLRRRGIVLAVCSKNDDAVARTPFREHPDMILREEHFAVFQANWQDKASNIRQIAATLELGLDAMVFVDDNPFEREQVRTELPSVAVPELPDDPALFTRVLASAGLFEAVTFTAEDSLRADEYGAQCRRVELREAAPSLEAYLASLDMALEISSVTPLNRARVTQLINKTNQFNLTTRRYTEAQVAELEADPAVRMMAARLTDRFGDTGLIAVIIAHAHARQWEIDNWLMSCRVLNRGVEHAMLNHLAAMAAAEGVRTLVGRYVASGRNGMVEGHYGRLGFTKVADEDGASRWELDLSRFTPSSQPIAIVSTTATKRSR